MSKRLLVVDDEEILLKGLKYSLEQEGYIIDDGVDGIEAYEKVMNNTYDYIVLE